MSLDEILAMSPFSLPIPANRVARIKAFVRELVAGAVHEFWTHEFYVQYPTPDSDGWGWDAWGRPSPYLEDYVTLKWENATPSPELLTSLGYMTGKKETHFEGRFELTAHAYSLLDETVPAPVFISYANADSSAFALLIASRLREVGLDPFLDIAGLRGGDDWDAVLQAKIIHSDYFVALIGPTSLQSDYVRKEIQLAHDKGLRIIPVLHSGMTDATLRQAKSNGDGIAAILETRQAIKIEDERARDYNAAVVDILNVLGIAP